MSDIGDYFDDYREAQRERREERLPIRQAAIKSLTGNGYIVKEMDRGYCFRINQTYDLYPIHNRWHDLRTGRRGGTRDLKAFILENLPLASTQPGSSGVTE